MGEDIRSPETPSMINRAQVIEVFRKFVVPGVGDPADLDLSDPEVIAANQLHEAWVKQEDAKADLAGTEESRLLLSLELTPLFADAGFTGKDYLDDIVDWLNQDLWVAEEAGLNDVAARIQLKINEINAKLKP
jgi:hypothetical protein